MQQQPGPIPGGGEGGAHSHTFGDLPQARASPPWPQLCEKNAKGPWVLQPCANIHGGTIGEGEERGSFLAGLGGVGGEE